MDIILPNEIIIEIIQYLPLTDLKKFQLLNTFFSIINQYPKLLALQKLFDIIFISPYVFIIPSHIIAWTTGISV